MWILLGMAVAPGADCGSCAAVWLLACIQQISNAGHEETVQTGIATARLRTAPPRIEGEAQPSCRWGAGHSLDLLDVPRPLPKTVVNDYTGLDPLSRNCFAVRLAIFERVSRSGSRSLTVQ